MLFCPVLCFPKFSTHIYVYDGVLNTCMKKIYTWWNADRPGGGPIPPRNTPSFSPFLSKSRLLDVQKGYGKSHGMNFT